MSISNDLLWPFIYFFFFLPLSFLPDEKPKLKLKLVPLEATSARLETDCFSPQSKCTRTGPDGDKQRGRGEPSCSPAPRRRLVVVLERLPTHEIHAALRPPAPKLHDIGGCSYDDRADDNDDDNVIDKDWGVATGSDSDSSSDDPRKGLVTARARKTK